MIRLAVHDETASGDTLASLELQLESERVTVAELIRARVHQEVRDHNARAASGVFNGLVQPEDAERELNGYRLRRPRAISAERQELEQQVELQPGSSVTFLKLVPLVGG
jgi:hypothetical protein